MKIIKHKWILPAVVLLAAILSGFLIGLYTGGNAGDQAEDRSQEHQAEQHEGHEQEAEVQEWTCSMHPQIREDEPGDCPICGMELIPASAAEDHEERDPMVYEMSPEAMAVADIHTTEVEKVRAEKNMSLTGKVRFNERLLTNETSDFAGRIEKLYINFSGQRVLAGDPLASVYSPELVTAQKELLEALKVREKNPELYRSAREKLKRWNLSDQQIDEIEKRGEVRQEFDIHASSAGVVTERLVTEGDYVGAGEVLFRVGPTDNLWIELDAYESDLAWVGEGDIVEFTTPALPGKEFRTGVDFIDPVVDDNKRTARAIAEIRNNDMTLKPGMFVNATVKSTVRGGEPSLVIPRTALLWTGKRSIVYVRVPDVEQPRFEMREILLGPSLGDSYLVESGLDEGERIVTNGVFTVDASAQLNGDYSMMTPPPVKTFDVPDAFVSQLTDAAKEYFEVKNALVESDPEKAASFSASLKAALSEVDMALLEDEPHHKWMGLLEGLTGAAGNIEVAGDLEEQRMHFEHLSQYMIDAVEYFGFEIERVYRMHCPMAFDDEGADWLSDSEEILNPYFGDAMLRCGEIRETYRKGARVFEREREAPSPEAGHRH